MNSEPKRRSGFPIPRPLQRLPFWLAALIISFVPIRMLAILDYLVSPSAVGNLVLDVSLVISLLIFYLLYAMRYISRRLGRLEEYARQLSPDDTSTIVHPSLRPARLIILWAVLVAANSVLFPIPGDFVSIFAEGVPVFAYFFLILAAFLYVYGTSMLAIYRAGSHQMKLKQFTEDRTLGLKPFGTTSLRLTSVYATFPLVITLIQLVNINVEIGGGVTVTPVVLRPSDIIFVAALVLVGVALFFLPLLSIHRRLLEAKREELAWIAPQYTAIVQKLRSMTTGSYQQDSVNKKALADELTTVRQVQSDIQRIQTWPFDLGVITRLATILVLPPILGVMARILIILILRI